MICPTPSILGGERYPAGAGEAKALRGLSPGSGYLQEVESAVSAFNALNDKHKEHPLSDALGSRVMGRLTASPPCISPDKPQYCFRYARRA